MAEDAHAAVETAWQAFIHVRALCPSAHESAIGSTGWVSPGWYQARGAVYVVSLPGPMTSDEFDTLQRMTAFVNRSFVITLAAILEAYGIVPYRADPDRSLDGGDEAQLVKWLRNRFAHGQYDYDQADSQHVETRQLLEHLLPEVANRADGFPAAIDSVLEPLKEGVQRYIAAHQRLA